MATGADLVTLTGEAIQPLLSGNRNTSSNDMMSLSPPTYTIFSPLPDGHSGLPGLLCPPGEAAPGHSHTSRHTQSSSAPPPTVVGVAKTRKRLITGAEVEIGDKKSTLRRSPIPNTMLSSEEKTLSPLTVSAQDMEAGSMELSELASRTEAPLSMSASCHVQVPLGREESSGVRSSSPVLPPASVSSHPSLPRAVSPVTTPGVKIRIAAKKVREIPSPHGSQSSGASLSFESFVSSEETPGTYSPAVNTEQDAKRNVPRTRSSQLMVNKDDPLFGKPLAQGVLKSTQEPPSMNNSLESSVIVDLTEQRVTTHKLKERLLEQQAVEKTRKTRVVEPQMVNEEGDAIHSTASAPPMEQASHFTSNMRALPAEILSPEHESHAQSSSFPPTRIPASQVPESKTNFPSPSHFSSPQCHASTVPVNTSVTASAPRPHPPPMGFAETVKLVATCTAAATAAALASQRGPPDEAKGIKKGRQREAVHSGSSREKPGKRETIKNRSTAPPFGASRTLSGEGMGSGGGDTSSHYTPGRQEHHKKGISGQALPHQGQPHEGLAGRDKQTSVELYPNASVPSQPWGGTAWHKHGGDSFPAPLVRSIEGGSMPAGLGAQGATGLLREPLPVRSTDWPELPDLKTGAEEQQALFEVEKMLMEVQQEHREMETQHALTAAKQDWAIPSPTDRSPTLDSPTHHIADFLSELSRKPPEDNKEKEAKQLGKITGTPLSVVKGRGRGGGGRGEGRGREKYRAVFSKGIKQRGRGVKGKYSPGGLGSQGEGNAGPTGRGNQKDTHPLERTRAHAAGTRERSHPPTSGQSPTAERWRAPPPSLPILHSQLAAPAGLPQFVYPLTTVPTCDPSTGMLLGTAPSDTVPPPLRLPPPSVHMTTAIPLGPPRTMPSEATPPSVSPHPLPRSQPSPPATRPATTDACLQTSFSEKEETKEKDKRSTTHLVLEVLPATNISGTLEPKSEVRQCPSTPLEAGSDRGQKVYAAVAEIENESAHISSSDDASGVLLEGKFAECSPSPFPPAPFGQGSVKAGGEDGRRVEGGGGTMLAEEMDQRMRQHLQRKALEWVTQELLTRVLAEGQSHDLADEPWDESLNSCSTCTPHPPTHTPSHPNNSLTTADALGEAGVQLFVDAGVPVRGDLVEEIVRDVIREKVIETVREAQAQQRGGEEEEKRETDRALQSEEGYGHGYSSDSAPATPLVSTPQPTPPPSPPPSHSVGEHPTMPHPLLATPTPTPPLSRRSESVAESSAQSISTPQVTEDDISVSVTEEDTQGGMSTRSTTLPPTLTTPSTTPPPQPPLTPSPPSTMGEQAVPPPSPPHPSPPQQTHTTTDKFSLSETSSPSSTSTEAHSHPHSITTTTLTDQEISMGECMLSRPPLPPTAASLSEGEVALSPGDARWYATYAAKMGKWGPQLRDKGRTKSDTPKLTEAAAAFLELKNSPELSSDTSDYSGSFRSDSKTLSEGETKHKPRHTGDPFDRFLAKLQSSSPETSSTPSPPSAEEDNTLAEMPSIAEGYDLSRGEAKEREATPQRPPKEKKTSPSVPYHKQYPLQVGSGASPGEIRRDAPSEEAGRSAKRRDKSDLSVSFAQSEGEAHPAVRTARAAKTAKKSLPEFQPASSPGEIRLRLGTANKTRDGIDVISLSPRSSRSLGSEEKHSSEVSQETLQTQPSLSTPSPLLPHSRPAGHKGLRVSELEPAQLVQVTSSLIGEASDDIVKAGSEGAPGDRGEGSFIRNDSKRVTPSESHPSALVVPATVPLDLPRPELDHLYLQTSTSSSSSLSAKSPPPPSSPPDQQPKKGLGSQGMPRGRHESSTTLQLHSFWDLGGHSPPAGRVREGPAPAAAATRTEAGTQRPTLATAASGGSGQEGEPPTIPALPARTQLRVTVPTVPTEEPSQTSPTYSSDFEFSSLSQPTFD